LRSGYERVSGWGSRRERARRRFRSPAGGGGSLRERAMSRFRSPAGWWGSLRERAMSGFRSPAGGGSFRPAAAGDRLGGASRRAPLTPGSGLLHRRFAVPSPLPDFSRTGRDAPSLARPRLFATSLSLVLKSLIRSALQTASLTPRCYFCFSFRILRCCGD